MAVYKFAESIYEGSPVIIRNSTSTRPVGRDFTFISDVVDGLLLALEHMPSTCGHVYNIGHGQTVELVHLLELMEMELNKTAKAVSNYL